VFWQVSDSRTTSLAASDSAAVMMLSESRPAVHVPGLMQEQIFKCTSIPHSCWPRVENVSFGLSLQSTSQQTTSEIDNDMKTDAMLSENQCALISKSMSHKLMLLCDKGRSSALESSS
jgi:hypothetical protein